ncbi:glucose PTS transporter subunit EIIB [Streptomyces venezuelae]|uniref:glucose PTS transporter subunit EIIB n=1 Tax=Streptomyces venezuelae TaxID=54571 RepID=UPI003648F546
MGEVLLRPIGLHHILVAMSRFTDVGGHGVVCGDNASGALNLFYAQLNCSAAPTREVLSATHFLSQGKMAAYLGGLVAGKYDPVAILEAIGGADTIRSLDNCITRLRMTVEDADKLDEARLKRLGAVGVVKLDQHNEQVIIGPQVQSVKDALAGLTRVD